MISTSGSEFTSPSSDAAIIFRIQSTWTWNRRSRELNSEVGRGLETIWTCWRLERSRWRGGHCLDVQLWAAVASIG